MDQCTVFIPVWPSQPERQPKGAVMSYQSPSKCVCCEMSLAELLEIKQPCPIPAICPAPPTSQSKLVYRTPF